MQMYIILNETSGGVCFSGSKPFIGQLKAAEEQADFLKSVNPEEDYVVAKITLTPRRGKVTARFAGEHKEKEEKKKTRIRNLKDLK